jgi:hypothetical protein
MVRTFPAADTEAPSEPGAESVGVPLNVTVPAPGDAGVIVTVNVPVAVSAAAEFSTNVKVAAVAEVPPCGIAPTPDTVIAASAAGAAAVARSAAMSAALVPMLNAFLRILKV